MRFALEIMGLTALVALPITGIIGLLLTLEKRRKRRHTKFFQEFSRNNRPENRDFRGMRRILVPEILDVSLKVSGDSGSSLKGVVCDLSLSGTAAYVKTSVKSLKNGMVFKDVRFMTPINSFTIKEMKLMRFADRNERRRIAFKFTRIEAGQFENLKMFMAYLEKYMNNGFQKY